MFMVTMTYLLVVRVVRVVRVGPAEPELAE